MIQLIGQTWTGGYLCVIMKMLIFFFENMWIKIQYSFEWGGGGQGVLMFDKGYLVNAGFNLALWLIQRVPVYIFVADCHCEIMWVCNASNRAEREKEETKRLWGYSRWHCVIPRRRWTGMRPGAYLTTHLHTNWILHLNIFLRNCL